VGNPTNAQAVAVSWTPRTESDLSGYVVFYWIQGGTQTNSAVFLGAINGTISRLQGGATYNFAVAPIDDYGVEPVASDVVSYAVPVSGSLMLQAQRPAASAGVELTWNDLSAEGVVDYNIYYGTQVGINFDMAINCNDVTDFTVGGLVPGQLYYFVVEGLDAFGHEIAVSTVASSEAAGPIPLQLQVQGTTTAIGAVDVSWLTSPDTNVIGYEVYYGTQSTIYTNSQTFYYTTNGLISGLAGGTTYYFALAPVDIYSTEPIASGEVSFAVPAMEPLALQAQVLTNATGVELSWNAITNEGVAGYSVYYGTQSGFYEGQIGYGDVTNAVIQYLDPGQTYYFTVAATDNYSDQGPLSNEASVAFPWPAPMLLQVQTYTDDNGQPYAMEIDTPTAVFGNWEMDYSTDLQNWTPYTYGFGGGTGDGHDVDVSVPIDPTQPPLFFRVINY